MIRQWIALCEELSALPKIDKWFAEAVLDAAISLGIDMSDWAAPSSFDDVEEPEDEDDRTIANIESALNNHMEDDILPNVKHNQLRIYRAIESNMIRSDQLGIHWTTRKKSAYPYWGKRQSQWYVLEGLVALKDVWWTGTMALHLEGGEYEVRLDRNVPVQIIGAERHTAYGIQQDNSINHLIGQTLTT